MAEKFMNGIVEKAVASGDLELLMSRSTHDSLIDIIDENGNNLLFKAVAHRQTDVIDYFIDALHFDVNVQNNWGDTPLIQAATNSKSIQILSQLLAYRANPLIRNNLQDSALDAAIRNNIKANVEFLLPISEISAVPTQKPYAVNGNSGNSFIYNDLIQREIERRESKSSSKRVSDIEDMLTENY